MNLKVLVTTKCNMKCRKCNHHLQEDREIPLDLLGKINANFEEIFITGGEPTTSKKLPLILNYLASYGKVGLYSNCLDLNTEKIQQYRDAGLKKVMGWIDTISESEYKWMTEVDGFSRVLGNIRDVINGGLNFVLNTSISQNNSGNVREIIDLGREIGVICFSFNLMTPQPNSEISYIGIDKFLRIRKNLEEYVQSRGGSIDRRQARDRCNAPIYVHTDGKVYLCVNKRNFIGDLKDTTLSKILDSSIYRQGIKLKYSRKLDLCKECTRR
jgi:MoaA/NifB/PqqE/SkfB family radical SAM enzyme